MYEELLRANFNIKTQNISEVRGGWSAKAYRVDTDDGAYFLKVYDKSLSSTRPWVERIDDYIPALGQLSEVPELRGRIVKPIKTASGEYKVETPDHVLLLFEFIDGAVPGPKGLTVAQITELAEMLAILHESSDIISADAPGLAEDTSLSFLGQLIRFLDGVDSGSGELNSLVRANAGMLRAAAEEALRLRDTLRAGYSPLVLCHGDAHGGNVIFGERFVLADWEDLQRAPAEADLFIHAWHPHGTALLEAYAAARGGYRINRELLYYYVLRRRLEDVWVDIQRLTEDSPDGAEAAVLLDYTRRGVEEIRKLYNRNNDFKN